MSRAAAVLLAAAVCLSLAPPSSAFGTPFSVGALGLHQIGSSRAAAARLQLVRGFAGRGGTGVLVRDARRTAGRVGFSMNAPKVLVHLYFHQSPPNRGDLCLTLGGSAPWGE